MQCVGNVAFAGEELKPKVLILGTSNSIIKGGWFSSFYAKYKNDFDIINLSLGACTSVYLSYQITLNEKIFKEADIIIIEPIVNDISYLPNRQINESTLMTSIRHIYEYISSLKKVCFTLLLPTLKRTNLYFKNNVYLEHAKHAKALGFHIIDLHPLYYKELKLIDSLFLDPGHINLQFAHHLGGEIGKMLKIKELEITSGEHAREGIYKIIKPELGPLRAKRNSKYTASLNGVSMGTHVSLPYGYELAGMLHWNDKNRIEIEIKSDDKKTIVELKGKYLKLTSPPDAITSSFEILAANNEIVYISEFLLQKTDAATYINPSVKQNVDKECRSQSVIDLMLSNAFYKYLTKYKDIIASDFDNHGWISNRDTIKDVMICKNLIESIESTEGFGKDLTEIKHSLNQELDNIWDN